MIKTTPEDPKAPIQFKYFMPKSKGLAVLGVVIQLLVAAAAVLGMFFLGKPLGIPPVVAFGAGLVLAFFLFFQAETWVHRWVGVPHTFRFGPDGHLEVEAPSVTANPRKFTPEDIEKLYVNSVRVRNGTHNFLHIHLADGTKYELIDTWVDQNDLKEFGAMLKRAQAGPIEGEKASALNLDGQNV